LFVRKGGESVVIEIKEVSKVYPARGKGPEVVALRDVSLSIARGDIFGIVGHSGAGKSTLLRLLNGLEKPTSGSVIVDGLEISRLSPSELRKARRNIGMIFQHFHLLWSRTVRENVAFPLEIAGRPKKEINRKVDELLERVGLADRAEAYPSQLSGGQKQRVGIARALANDPHVLLCDEATSALDPETTASILNLLREIHRETGITMVLITHEMSVVRAICNRMAVMEGGRIVETGEVEAIFRNPVHPLTRQFVRDLADHSVEPRREESGFSIFLPVALLPRLQEEAGRWGVTFRLEGEIKAETVAEVPVRILGDAERARQALEALKEEVKLHA
jgi:D-methionine transport system ATP-binding protein